MNDTGLLFCFGDQSNLDSNGCGSTGMISRDHEDLDSSSFACGNGSGCLILRRVHDGTHSTESQVLGGEVHCLRVEFRAVGGLEDHLNGADNTLTLFSKAVIDGLEEFQLIEKEKGPTWKELSLKSSSSVIPFSV